MADIGKEISKYEGITDPVERAEVLYILNSRVAAGQENAEPGFDKVPKTMTQYWIDAATEMGKVANLDKERAFNLALTTCMAPRGTELEDVKKWTRGDGPLALATEELSGPLLSYLENDPGAGELVVAIMKNMNFDFVKLDEEKKDLFTEPDCFLAVASMYLGSKLVNTGSASAEMMHGLALEKLANPKVAKFVRRYWNIDDTAWIATALKPMLSTEPDWPELMNISSPDGAVQLETLDNSDAKRLFEVLGHDNPKKYPNLESVIANFTNLKNKNVRNLGIRDKEDTLIGVISLTASKDNPDEVEISYHLGSEFADKGYIRKSVETLTAYVTQQLEGRIVNKYRRKLRTATGRQVEDFKGLMKGVDRINDLVTYAEKNPEKIAKIYYGYYSIIKDLVGLSEEDVKKIDDVYKALGKENKLTRFRKIVQGREGELVKLMAEISNPDSKRARGGMVDLTNRMREADRRKELDPKAKPSDQNKVWSWVIWGFTNGAVDPKTDAHFAIIHDFCRAASELFREELKGLNEKEKKDWLLDAVTDMIAEKGVQEGPSWEKAFYGEWRRSRPYGLGWISDQRDKAYEDALRG